MMLYRVNCNLEQLKKISSYFFVGQVWGHRCVSLFRAMAVTPASVIAH